MKNKINNPIITKATIVNGTKFIFGFPGIEIGAIEAAGITVPEGAAECGWGAKA
ncbi:MAG: hypothetical protein AABW59_03140 [archaeon]